MLPQPFSVRVAGSPSPRHGARSGSCGRLRQSGGEVLGGTSSSAAPRVHSSRASRRPERGRPTLLLLAPREAGVTTEPVAAQLAGSFAGGCLSSWLSPRTVCVCETSPVDRAVLGLLRDQLQRCGPEHLAASCESAEPSWTLVVLVFFIGVLVGSLLVVFGCRKLSDTGLQPAPRPAAPDLPEEAALSVPRRGQHTPSSLRALRNDSTGR